MHCCRDCYLQAKSWHFSHGCLAFPFLPLDKCTARLACSLLITEVTRLLGFSLAENFSLALIGCHKGTGLAPEYVKTIRLYKIFIINDYIFII